MASTLSRLILRRIITGGVTLVTVTALIFWLAGIAPFDPIAAHLGAAQEFADAQTRARIAEQLGVNDPWWRHWLVWWRGLITGDLGWSSAQRQPVAEVLGDRLGWSILLGAVALVVAAVAASLLALASVRRPGGIIDRTVSAAVTVVAATPAFLLCLGLIAVLAVGFGWFPAGGVAPAGEAASVGVVAGHLVLPTLALAAALVPWLTLHLRESMFTVHASPAVTGARARGATEAQVLTGQVLPAAVMPAITVLAARLPELVTGTVVVEAVFGWPGIGQALVRAATAVDHPLLAATTLIAGIVVVAGNLAADVLQWQIDRRSREGLQ